MEYVINIHMEKAIRTFSSFDSVFLGEKLPA